MVASVEFSGSRTSIFPVHAAYAAANASLKNVCMSITSFSLYAIITYN
nr:MAG TPA: hypothetical protein [Caudoviricetes sp.]